MSDHPTIVWSTLLVLRGFHTTSIPSWQSALVFLKEPAPWLLTYYNLCSLRWTTRSPRIKKSTQSFKDRPQTAQCFKSSQYSWHVVKGTNSDGHRAASITVGFVLKLWFIGEGPSKASESLITPASTQKNCLLRLIVSLLFSKVPQLSPHSPQNDPPKRKGCSIWTCHAMPKMIQRTVL